MTAEFIFGDLTYYLRGVGFRIHNTLKGGHSENAYEQALTWVLENDGVEFWLQRRYTIEYRERQIGEYYPDFMLADGKVVLELKATSEIMPLYKAQVLSYMAVTKADLGFIMNFGGSSLETERLPNFLANRQSFQWNQSIRDDMIYSELADRLLNLLHLIHHQLGPGFLSQVYRRATRIELSCQGINFVYLKELPLQFEGRSISTIPTRLFWIEGKILLGTFALNQITHHHTEKMRWAMQEQGCQLGLIANFYPNKLDFRFIYGSG